MKYFLNYHAERWGDLCTDNFNQSSLCDGCYYEDEMTDFALHPGIRKWI